MRGKLHLYIDQYGQKYWAKSVKELKEKVGYRHITTMFCDKKEGPPVRTGYVIGPLWLTRFAPVELPA